MPQPPSWFKFSPLPAGTDFSRSAIDGTLIYPGVKLERDGQTIRAPLNAAWLVEAALRGAGQAFKVHTPYVAQKKWPASLDDIKELRKIDPKTGVAMGDFVNAYQIRETFRTMTTPGVLFRHPTGAGKSLEAMIWTLAQPGQIVIVTGAKGRVQWKNQIERFTTATSYVVVGTGAYETHEFEVGGSYTYKEVRAAIDLWKGVNLDPRGSAQCSCGDTHRVEVVRQKSGERQSGEPTWAGAWTFIARATLREGVHRLSFSSEIVPVRATTIPRDARFVIVGWEILAYHVDVLCKLKPAAVVLDECFPADTLVETEMGPRRIADIVPGDRVWSWDYEKHEAVLATVTFTWRRPVTSHRLVRVTHERGSFICTENHNIWVEGEGYYVNAGALNVRDHLRVLRPATQAAQCQQPQAEVLQQGLLSEVAGVHSTRQGYQLSGRSGGGGPGWWVQGPLETAELPQDCHDANEEAQPDEGRCQQGEVVSHAQSAEAQATFEARKRLGNDEPRTVDPQRAADIELEPRNRDSTVVTGSVRLPSSQLQGGLRLGTVQAGNRDRRIITQGTGQTRARPPQGEDFVFSRVVTVEVLERDSVEEPESGGERDFVYDLEVGSTHNYFADGVLVSNSHHGQQHKQWRIVPLSEADLATEPKAKQLDDGRWVKYVSLDNTAACADKLCKVTPRRLLLTATLVRDRIRNAWAQLNFLAPWDFGSYWTWAKRYAGAVSNVWGGMDDKGNTNIEELSKRLSFHDSYVTRAEANANLPDVRREIVYLPPEAQHLEDPGFARELMSAAPATITSIKLAAACSRKRKALVEVIVEAANGGAKVCVFTARHNDVDVLSSVLQNKLGKSVRLFTTDGRTPVDKRAALVAEYMALSTHAVLVAVGYALGEQIDLNETDLAIVAMLPVTPADIVQWEGRWLRQGSTRRVLIQYWVAEGTIDERMVSIVLDKLPAMEQIGTEGVAGIARSLKGDEAALLAELAQSVLSHELPDDRPEVGEERP